MDTQEIVSNVSASETSLPITFTRNASSSNAKAPRFHYQIHHSGMLSGLVVEGAIFKNDGEYNVTIPGSKGFPSLKAAQETIKTDDGRTYVLASRSPVGLGKLERFEGAVKTALYEWLKADESGKATPETRISL